MTEEALTLEERLEEAEDRLDELDESVLKAHGWGFVLQVVSVGLSAAAWWLAWKHWR